MQKTLLSSLRLKDVLDSSVMQISDLAGGAKVAIFLSDNESLALKLMAAKGYSQGTLNELKVMPFSTESLLKYVVQKRATVTANSPSEAPEISAAIMQREGSAAQLAIPLTSSSLLVGAVLVDVNNNSILGMADFLTETCEVVALAIANSILFGRSEYERERLSTLYKTSCALSSHALQVSDVLQISADTAIVLGNSPYSAILLFEGENSSMRLAAYKGLEGSSLKDFDLSLKDTLAGSALRSGKTEYIGDGFRSPFGGLPRAAGGAQFASALALPLIHQQQQLGVMMLFSPETRAFHREQIDLLESLAVQVSTALNTALKHESATATSIIDVHTGLYNRAHFDQTLAKEIDRSHRHNHELGVLLVDIDHLALLNEHLGSEKGDEAIRHIARCLQSSLREIDVVCRTGGAEFGIILPETTSSAACDVAERLRNRIRSESVAGIGVVTVSIGEAAFPANADSAEPLLKAASEALDIAKFEGRDRIKGAETGKIAPSGPIAWDELAQQARLAVINDRQRSTQSHLSVAPEYANWITKTPSRSKEGS
ncbi:MAG TPA: sensor domain-containing diguanylate cyclase [Oculatellaceae cyanobacterium]